MHKIKLKSFLGSFLRSICGLQWLNERKLKRPIIVCYHGIVEKITDPFLEEYCIDIKTFSQHIKFLKKLYVPVSLSTLIEALNSDSEVNEKFVVVTFDDALKNQICLGGSILNDYNVPWALAVPSGLIEKGRSIWTYELSLLLYRCWKKGDIALPGFPLKKITVHSLREKHQALLIISKMLFHKITAREKLEYIDSLIDKVGRSLYQDKLNEHGHYSLATWNELKMVAGTGTELLAHGWYHFPQNDTLSDHDLEREIIDSRNEIFKKIGVKPQGFALPHGMSHPKTNYLLKRAGYNYCLTSNPQHVQSKMFPYSLPRINGEYPLSIMRRHITCRE